MWENKKRDRTGTLEAFENAYEDDLTDRKVRTCIQALIAIIQLTSEHRIRNFVIYCRLKLLVWQISYSSYLDH